MQSQKKKSGAGKIVLIVIISIVLLLGVAAALFFLLGGPGIFGRFEGSPEPYIAEGEVCALSLELPQDEVNESAIKEYFSQAVKFAKENGFNTIVFSGEQEGAVWWRDPILPMIQDLQTEENQKLDPLSLLCNETREEEIQLWLRVPADMATAGTDSLAQLPQNYPLAGLVLSDVEEEDRDSIFAITEAFADGGYQTVLNLAFSAAETTLKPDTVAEYISYGQVRYILPSEGTAEWFAAYGAAGSGLIAVQPPQDDAATTLFTAAAQPAYEGALLGSYPELADQPAGYIGFLKSALVPAEGELPEGFTIPRSLQINYPLESDTIEANQQEVFVMGNSDPSQPLYLDGEEVPRHTSGGSFGIAVPLEDGENNFTFSQGEETYTLTIKRPNGTGTGVSGERPDDNTREAEPGQAVQITGVFAGALTDPGDDSAINETLYGGAVAVVEDCVRTVRYRSDYGRNVNTWAYRLTSGDYILAYNCTWIDGDGISTFTGLSAESEDRGEWIRFEGTGTPAVTLSCEDGVLSVTMYDTAFSLPGGFSSELVQSASVEEIEGGVVLHLQAKNIWGYAIDYTDQQTRLFLKRAPVLSDDPVQPLAGVRIMLDPGHGDQDVGAAGVMGSLSGPNEKDMNLAQAQAIAYRLRQLGAEVTMIREGETFYTTQERLGMHIEEKPDFFLSVHHNSAGLDADRNDVQRAEVYYFMPANYSAPLSALYAQNLMDDVSAATGRNATEASWGYYNVLRTPVCPGALFEYGFVINPVEFEDIVSTDGLYAAACGTAEGIIKTLQG